VTVTRNAYGRQVESFEDDVEVRGIDHLVRGVFIRAPQVDEVGEGVEVLAEYGGKPVVAQQGNLLVAAFHPELVGETRLHAYLLGKV
jgi:5'-phosphate synthase pdxT subunit